MKKSEGDGSSAKAPLGHPKSPSRGELYPQFEHELIRELPGVADAFDLLREQLLLGYNYNTARAYWGDLQHWRDWCESQEPPIEPLHEATAADMQRYLDEMAERGYSPNTRARRLTSLRALFRRRTEIRPGVTDPTTPIDPIRRV